MRLVLDTNVYISKLLSPAGRVGQTFDYIVHAQLEQLMSNATLQELQRKLAAPKFRRYFSPLAAGIYFSRIQEAATIIEVTTELTVCADPDDDMLFELATDGQADYIISGDQKVLALDPFGQVRVVSPRGFVEELRVKD